jgi:hypothetical protein
MESNYFADFEMGDLTVGTFFGKCSPAHTQELRGFIRGEDRWLGRFAAHGGNLAATGRAGNRSLAFRFLRELQRLSQGTGRDEFAVGNLPHGSRARFDFVKPLKIAGDRSRRIWFHRNHDDPFAGLIAPFAILSSGRWAVR